MTHWPAHTLIEVVSFLRSLYPEENGIVRAVSEHLGVTSQSVSAVFRKDDTSLAWVEKVAKAHGYRLRLDFSFRFQGVEMDSKITQADYPDARNLVGFVDYARKYNLKINSLSVKAGVNYRIVERAFKKGDIKISMLKRMATTLGISIEWHWEPDRQ